MKILQLCNKPPYPPVDGGSKAMNNLTQGLLDLGHEVHVICISTPKHKMLKSELPRSYKQKTKVKTVYVDTSINVVDAFSDLITQDNYNISRFFSTDLDIELIKTFSENKYDIVQLESLFMTPYIPTIKRVSKAKIILRSHNLEYMIQERIASGEKNIFKKPYRKYLAKQLKEYEINILKSVDGIVAISSADAKNYKQYGSKTPIETIPFGVDIDEYRSYDQKKIKMDLFHLGSMDWLPNLEGIYWFLDKVWPNVHKNDPKVTLDLAGIKMPQHMLEMKMKNVRVQGKIPDALEFMSAGRIMVVPLFSAGGMRVKIIEGMALGKAIITTSIGAEGIAIKDGKNIMIANDAAQFSKAIKQLTTDADLCTEIGNNARATITKKYSNAVFCEELSQFYQGLIKK